MSSETKADLDAAIATHGAWQVELAADVESSVPFGVRVFVFHEREHLRAASGDTEAHAFSSTFAEVDSGGAGAVILLSLEDLHMSIVAHEVAHVALAHAGNVEATRVGAKRWLHEHPEWVAEMIGNLTAIVWYQIAEQFGDE